MQQNRRSGNGWIGWLIFIVLVFGSRFLPPVAAWLTQVTGLPISTPVLIAVIVGLGVVGSIVGSVLQEVSRNRGANETRLPTGLPPSTPPQTIAPPRPTSTPPRPTSAPPRPTGARPTGGAQQARVQSGEQRLPGPPRFEPIIDPRVLTFGIIGLVIFGGFFLVALLLSGSLP